MQVLLINATKRRESTYHVARMLADTICSKGGEIEELFLPDAMPSFCTGCGTCFIKDERDCPHYENVAAVEQAMERADVLIFATPVYVYHATGQLKTLLDHFGYRWMVHRPNGNMFRKQAVVISTAAGGGMRSANRDVADSLRFWGVGRVYQYGSRVFAIRWNGVPENRKQKLQQDMQMLGLQIRQRVRHITPALSIRMRFYLMRMIQRRGGLNPVDFAYWQKNGWLDGTVPWKDMGRQLDGASGSDEPPEQAESVQTV